MLSGHGSNSLFSGGFSRGPHLLSDFVVDVDGRAMELPDGLTGLEEVLLDEGRHLYLQGEHLNPLHSGLAHGLLTSSPTISPQ